MRCVILQPSFVPWRGYFDLIRRADVFVFYDDVQYDTRGWRNRNRIKTPSGPIWLTVPVCTKGARSRALRIDEARIAWGHGWRPRHLRVLEHSYLKAPFYQKVRRLLGAHYDRRPDLLCELTIPLTIDIARELGQGGTRFLRSSELGIAGERTERLVRICQHVGADRYLSGPSARAYIDPDAFEEAGVELEYMEYRYAEYPQLHPPYDPHVSILDLMMMLGPGAGSCFDSACCP